MTVPFTYNFRNKSNDSLRRRRLEGKGEGKGSFRREINARAWAREEGGKETPARKPLFSPSRLVIMYAKITQLWMTSCQISLAAIHLVLAFVFLEQDIWSVGTCYKKSSNAVVRWRRKLLRCVSCYIKSSINLFTSFAEGNVLDVATCMQCLSEKNLQSSQVKRTPQNSINEFIIRKLSPLAVVDFRFISTFLHA